MKNLHKCTVKVLIFKIGLPFTVAKQNQNGNFHYDGADVKLMQILAESLNFRINFTFIGDERFKKVNESYESALMKLYDGEVDLTICDWWLTERRSKAFDFTSAYATATIIGLVPPRRTWSSIEKLIYPFKISLWIAIFTSLIIGVFVIFVVKLQSKIIQNFVFGTNVKKPFLNLFITFIGNLIVSQKETLQDFC
jgi:hypothetical protein